MISDTKSHRASVLLIAAIAFTTPLLLCGDYSARDGTDSAVFETITQEPYDSISIDRTLPINDPYESFIIAFLPANIPSFSNHPFIEVNNGIPLFCAADALSEPFEQYAELDMLGRCGFAFANIGKELMPTEPRGQIGMVKPSGWHMIRYDDLIDDHYLYNRCHLIAHQLTGENANPLNLITGTRYMNIEGMQPFENRVAAYITRTENHVLYRVTPIFEGNNLVASGVLMEGYSIEDCGSEICFNVYVYNVQPGVIIDYATGDSQRKEIAEVRDKLNVEGFIGNVRSQIYHVPTCPNLPKRQNWIIFDSEDEAMAYGYSPCGNCIVRGVEATTYNAA